tara:strand:- start:4119 stop:4478 length:360 start_codon:yes stop_codon:yes gene_type:complete
MCRSDVHYRDVHRAKVNCNREAATEHLAAITNNYLEQLFILFRKVEYNVLNPLIYMQLVQNFQDRLNKAPPLVMALDVQNGMWFVSSMNHHRSLHGRRIKGGAWSTMHTMPSWPAARAC